MNRDEARALLGLRPGYSPGELDAAFRRGAMLTHPDRGGDPEGFKALVRSREVLQSSPSPRGVVVVVDDSHRIVRLLRRLRRHRSHRQPRVS